MKTVGILGLRARGMNLAERLLQGDPSCELIVYDEDVAKRRLYEGRPRVTAVPAPELAVSPQGPKIVVSTLDVDEELGEALMGPHGALGRLSGGGIHIAIGPADPETARFLAPRHAEVGAGLACIGLVAAAAPTTATGVVTGHRAAREAALTLLDTIGVSARDVGDDPGLAWLLANGHAHVAVATAFAQAELAELIGSAASTGVGGDAIRTAAALPPPLALPGPRPSNIARTAGQSIGPADAPFTAKDHPIGPTLRDARRALSRFAAAADQADVPTPGALSLLSELIRYRQLEDLPIHAESLRAARFSDE